MPRFIKSQGLTPSEQYLAKLCEKSFLSLWSWPNLFHIRGKQKHELCDLLVVFGNDVILFSDKSCKFKETDFSNAETLSINWKRWYRQSIQESANALHHAERWIKSHPDRIFIDNKCQHPLPVPLPPTDKIRFHKISIALNIKTACQQFFRGGSGSLNLNTAYEETEGVPFTVGRFKSGGFIHVFDDVTLDLVLKELDTIADFTQYLLKKEAILAQGRTIVATGEEELLAQYLTHMNEEKEHDFLIPDNITHALFPEGGWEGFRNHPVYAAKKRADKVSYVWDKLIEEFSKNIIGNTLEYGNDEELSYHEEALRHLASENRFIRRCLGDAFMEAAHKSTSHDRFSRVIYAKTPHKVFIFLFLANKKSHGTYQEYREVRRAMLLAYCKVLKYKDRNLQEIVGIAIEPPGGKNSSEDLLYYECNYDLDSASLKEAKELKEKLDIFRDGRVQPSYFHAVEYPKTREMESEIPPGLNRKERRHYMARLRRKK